MEGNPPTRDNSPSYKLGLSYSKMTGKRPGLAEGVRLIEASVKRELTVTDLL